MGAEAALFSPAKMSSIPEIVRADRHLGGQRPDRADDRRGDHRRHHRRRNALRPDRAARRSALGDFRRRPDRRRLGGPGGQPVASARCGRPIPAGASPSTPWGRPSRDLAALAANRALLLAAMASAFYWFLAAVSQVNVDRLADYRNSACSNSTSVRCSPRWRWASGLGSALAGVWSAGKIELGMVPGPPAGMAVELPAASASSPAAAARRWSAAYDWSCLGLLALGFSAGFFDVPLQAFLQHRSPPAIAGLDPGGRAISSPSPACCGRRAFSGWPAKSSTFPPGTSSSSAACSPCPWSSASVRFLAAGIRSIRRMAADAAGLSGARGRDGEHPRERRRQSWWPTT